MRRLCQRTNQEHLFSKQRAARSPQNVAAVCLHRPRRWRRDILVARPPNKRTLGNFPGEFVATGPSIFKLKHDIFLNKWLLCVNLIKPRARR